MDREETDVLDALSPTEGESSLEGIIKVRLPTDDNTGKVILPSKIDRKNNLKSSADATRTDHSTLNPEALTTGPQRAISSSMKSLAFSESESGIASRPWAISTF